MNILVVDDEIDVKRLFEQRFRREIKSGKVKLYFAFSSEEALGFLAQEELPELTLILSDINIPSMNGLELLKTIRPQFPDLEIYMITAYGSEEYRNMAEEYGANDYFTKPLDFKGLKDRFMGSEEKEKEA